MHSHLTFAIVNKDTGSIQMPAESRQHCWSLNRYWFQGNPFVIKRLVYDPQPETKLRGYGITKPGYLMIKYLADNPCAKMTDIVKHIMMEIKGELEYIGVYDWNSETNELEQTGKRVYYAHYGYLFTPHHSNMTTYGKKTVGRKWIHRFKGPDGVYRYHLTALGLDAANKIWQRHHYKWAKVV